MARARRVVAAVLTVVAVLGTAACGGGGGSDAGGGTFAPRPTTGLATMLETPPKYSGPGTSEWSRTYDPTVTEFVDKVYDKPVRKKITADLTEQGLTDLAHVLWVTDDKIQSDIVVLRFADVAGATARFEFVNSTNSGNGELRSFTFDGPGTPIVYTDTRVQEHDFRISKAYAQLGTYVVEMFVYSPGDTPRMQIEKWLSAQVALLA